MMRTWTEKFTAAMNRQASLNVYDSQGFMLCNGLFPFTDPDSYCDPDSDTIPIVTARKRSLRRLCFYRCLSVHSGGGSASVHAGRPPCQGDPPEPLARETPLQGDTPARESPLPGRPPCQRDPPARETPFPPPGPHPRGKLRGIRSRPTPKGEMEGDQIQANTQGGNFGGIRSRSTAKGEIEGDHIQAHSEGKIRRDQVQANIQGGNSGGSEPPPPNDHCCGRYASYWNAFLLAVRIGILIWFCAVWKVLHSTM